MNVFHKVLVGHGNGFANGFEFGVAHNADYIALVILNRGVGGSGSNFGAFRVDENGQMARYLAHVVNHTFHAGCILVCRVQADNVHTGVIQTLDESYIATYIRNGGNNLGFLVHIV